MRERRSAISLHQEGQGSFAGSQTGWRTPTDPSVQGPLPPVPQENEKRTGARPGHVAMGEDGLVIAVRSEETDFEVPEHPDAPEDRAALQLVPARGRLEAREQIVAIREFDEDGVPFAS